jgi:gliding motility-associated-like protein
MPPSKTNTYLVAIAFVFLCQLFYSQTHSGGYTFVENKGQWPENVNYRADLKAGYLYLENDGLMFNLYDAATVNKYVSGHYDKSLRKDLDTLKWHAYKVSFENCNTQISKQSIGKTSQYYNYFLGNDPKKWGSMAYGFEEVVYNEIYEGVDFKMYSQLFNLKYDFIVKPTGNPSDIQINYEGANKIALIKGKLHIYTEVNHIIEAEPVVYQVVDGKRKLVAASYKLNGTLLSYDITGEYDKSIDLIIDPTVIFSSYSGSFSNNFGYSATFDSKGFLYAGSSAFGNQYPTTIGAYNTSFNGGIVDIAISKFDTTGTFLIYSTYIGGASDELPHSLIVNSQDELFIFGTSSSFNYPTTVGCYDNSFNGGTATNMQNGLGVNYVNGSDIVVSRLSANGAILLASTYIGGSNNDGLNNTNTNPVLNTLRYNYADEVRGEVDIDKNNNIYIATCTRSADFPISSGAFQPTYGGGDLDGVVIKMDNNLQNIIWSSYIGGENHDAVYALAIDDSSDIYVTGGTSSTLFPTTSGALETSFQGGRSDGFVTHLKKDGSAIMHSTYIGSLTYDQSYFVEIDRPGSIYLLGQTEVTDSTFVKNVTFSNFGSGQFVTKLSPELDTMLYSTVFGSGNGINISPTAFLVDLCSKMYLAGWGGAVNNLATLDNNAGFTNGMPITSDAFQATTDGSDFYVMVLEDDASGVVYGSYFGSSTASEHVDGGTSRFDRKGKVYQAICAGCGGDDNMPIVPSNAVSSLNNNSCNLGVFKMDFDLPIVLADFEAPPIGCAPYVANFTNTSLSQLNTNYTWDFGDNTSSTVENPVHTYQTPGTYLVSLIIEDPLTCNFGDTIQKEITIIGDTTYFLTDLSICPEDAIQIGLLPSNDTSLSYVWTPASTLSSDTISNPFATPVNTTQYELLISNGVCTDTVLQSVIVNTPLLDVSNDTTLCSNSEIVTLTANSFGTSVNYIWSTNGSFSDTINSPITNNSITVSPSVSTNYYVQINNNGCVLSDTVEVNIVDNQLQITDNLSLCEGDSVLITATTLTPGQLFTYDWSPDDIQLTPDGNDNIWILPTVSGFFYLTAVSSEGCVILDSLFISVDPLPTLTTSAYADADTIIEGNSVGLHASPNGYSYSWSPGSLLNDAQSQNPIATLEETTTFTVTITSNSGCTRSESVTVFVREVVCGEPDLYIPNAFTPNADNANDYLYVRGNNIDEMLFRVYNRWGELVFETRDQSIGWDGTFKGRDCDPAVFDYYLEVTCIDQETFFKKGNITLIR